MIKLGQILNSYRLAENIPVRDLAREIGINYTVLAKFEKGRATKEATLAKIFVWLLSETSSYCGQQKRRPGGWQPGQSGNPEGSRKHKPKAKPALRPNRHRRHVESSVVCPASNSGAQ